MSGDMLRGLPGDWETEGAVLGGLMVATDLLDEVRAFLKPEHFWKPAHAALFRVICGLADKHVDPNGMAVLHIIEAKGISDRVGGVAYVTALPQKCMFFEKVPGLARLVRRDWVRRQAILALQKAEDVLKSDPEADASVLIGEALLAVDATTDGTVDDWHDLVACTAEAVRDIAARVENPGAVLGLSTSFPDLDRKIAGLRPARVYVLAARPKAGKTALMLQIALAAAEQGVGVGIVSLEMGRAELAERALALYARVDGGKLTRGEVDAGSEWRDVLDAHERLATLGVFVADTQAQTMSAIRAKAKRLRHRCEAKGLKLGLLCVDYLQLMGGDGDKGANREQVISGISRGLKILSKELDVPIVTLSQLSRKVEERPDKRPMPSDLRDSGAIEQDADVILFIYRDEVYDKASLKKGIAEIIVAANRGGETGTVELAFIGSQYRFAPLAHDYRPPPAAPTSARATRRKAGRHSSADPREEDER